MSASTKEHDGLQGPDLVPQAGGLSNEERRSVTHGGFWIPEREREVYKVALEALNAAGVPYIVSGLYAVYEYTGIYRETKDLDLFFQPRHLVPAAEVLRDEGFSPRLSQSHWLAKAMYGDIQVDMIFGIGNGLFFIDQDWYDHARPAVLAATPVRIAPPEDLILHRLFISERHRWDMSDVAHLILMRGHELDWDRLIRRLDTHWRLLLAQIVLFDYVYPSYRARVPDDVRERLLERERDEPDELEDPRAFRGTLVSKFSFAIDVNEWGLRDLRTEAVSACRSLPVIEEIRESSVWDEKAEENDG